MLKCPVCKTECKNNIICPSCGFDNLNPVFLSKDDGNAWINDVVIPYRNNYWKTLKEFDISIENRTIVKYRGANASVVIPYGIEVVGRESFYQNKDVREVYLPDTIKEIDFRAFSEATLEYISLQSGIELIDCEAFSNSSIQDISIPSTCKKIAMGAFNSCYSLHNVHLFPGVQCIEDFAFSGCDNLRNVFIPESVTEIECGAFATWSSCVRFVVDPRNRRYYSNKQSLIDRKYGEIISGSIYQGIPADENIYAIGDCAFGGGTPSKTLIIPTNISKINECAFGACDVANVFIPATVFSIENRAFDNVARCQFFCDFMQQPEGWDTDWCGAEQYMIYWRDHWKMVQNTPQILLLEGKNIFATVRSYIYDENTNQLKLSILISNTSDSNVIFRINRLLINKDPSNKVLHCVANARTETTCEFVYDEDDFSVVYIRDCSTISIQACVRNAEDQTTLISSNIEPVRILGFSMSTEDDVDDDEQLPF